MELISRQPEGIPSVIWSYGLLNYGKECAEKEVQTKCSHLRIMNHETEVRVRIT
jgi:hypothetical protein